MTVPLRGNCISLCSSLSTIDFTISRRWRLFIVSKAADMLMPEILIVVSSFSVFAASHLCVHIRNAVLQSDRNPLFFLTGIPQPAVLSRSGLLSIVLSTASSAA